MAGLNKQQQGFSDEVRGILQRNMPSSGLGNDLADQLDLKTRIGNGAEQFTGIGNESFEDATNRYRQRGEQLQQRTGPVVNEGQANGSRVLEMGALGMLRRQADGSAPSSSAILSQRANQNAIAAAGQQVAGARTTGGGIAALRGAGNTAGNAMLAGNAQNADQRAAEISRGQANYLSGTGAVRGQDIGVATQNAQLAAQQQALNEAGQQHYEGMGVNTRNSAQTLGQQAQGQLNTDKADLRQMEAQKSKQENDNAMQAVGTTMAVGSGGMSLAAARPQLTSGSDPRTKMNIGSLSALTRGRR